LETLSEVNVLDDKGKERCGELCEEELATMEVQSEELGLVGDKAFKEGGAAEALQHGGGVG
jgi:hypothetical protein